MYDQDYEETQEFSEEEAFAGEAPYEEWEDPYGAAHDEANAEPTILSTSQAINLTATIASLSALFALFLCFADQRSHAVRRFSVQSVGLGVLHLAVGMACWILSALLGWVPLVGYIFTILMTALFLGASGVALALRVRLMLHAYRGEAHVLPIIGQALRRFE